MYWFYFPPYIFERKYIEISLQTSLKVDVEIITRLGESRSQALSAKTVNGVKHV